MMEFTCCVSGCSDQVISHFCVGITRGHIRCEKTIEVVAVCRRWKKEEKKEFLKRFLQTSKQQNS